MASLTLSRMAAAAQSRAAAGSAAKRGFSSMLTAVEEFPGVPTTTPSQAKASTASVTALPNGVTVVTEDSSSTSTISLTFPNAGSGSEAIAEGGAALANKCMAFKSGSGLSSALILRNIEDDGATPFATAGRVGATVGYTAAPDKATRLVPLLATDSSFEKWDVRDAIKFAGSEAEDAKSNAQVVLTEQLYAAAYGAQTPMGRPFYSTGASFATVKSFRERAYGLNGAILAATGISDHEAFVRAVEHGFSESTVGEAAEKAASAYMGGEARVAAPSTGYAHVALAFEGPSTGALSSVLKHCINLTAGEGVSTFGTAGLIGVYGGADSAGASGIADALCAAVSAPSAAIVERAKSLAKAEALFTLDGGSQSLTDAMTKSVLETGTFSAEGIAASYDSITAKDVGAAFSAMAKSNPAMAAVGDIASVPYHASVASRFG